ncbi:MAG: universal stress protein [Dehalococcoidia bacterium]|nr:universal stress protein [Dehalococcoidia bacterium]
MVTPQTLLVPITNTPASLEAVAVAAAIAKARKGRVYLVHVIEVNRSLPLNAEMDAEARRGEQVIRKAEAVALEAGCNVTGTLVQAREAGTAIIDEAQDRGADAIIMGVGYKRLTGSFQVGRTVDHVLKNATCAVWVVRQSVAADHQHE